MIFYSYLYHFTLQVEFQSHLINLIVNNKAIEIDGGGFKSITNERSLEILKF